MTTPLKVMEDVAQVAMGLFHTCAVTTGGELYCWGENGSGNLGVPDTASSPTPVLVEVF